MFRTQAAGTKDSAEVKFEHDSHGHPTAITDPNGVTTQRRYDDFGRKIAEINPDRGITLYRHDAAGRLIARIDETQAVTRYRYDAAGRLLATGAGKDTELVRYRYEGMQLAEVIGTPDGKAEHAIERTQYERNAFGQVVREVHWISKTDGKPLADASLRFVTRSTYDEAGRLVEQALPDGHRLAYRYAKTADGKGKAGQLQAILFDGKEIITDIQQTQAEGLTGYVNGNGVRQQIERDGRGRIVQLQTIALHDAESTGWWARIQAWFAASKSEPGRLLYRQINRYDAANRLREIEREEASAASRGTIAWHEHYDYDRLDRLSGIDEGGTLVRLR